MSKASELRRPLRSAPRLSHDDRLRELTRVPLASAGVPEVDLRAPLPPGRVVELATRFGPTRLHLRETSGRDDATETAVHLHGLAGSSANWRDLAEVLGVRARSFALDLPGFGLSEPPAGFDFSRAAHLHVVLRFLEELDAGPVHLLGNSFGGALAIEVAALRPDLVSTLTLISPALPDFRPDPRRLSDQRMAWALVPLVGRRFRRQVASTSAWERTQRMLRLCFAEPEAVPLHRVNEAAAELRRHADLPWSGSALDRTTAGLLRSWCVPRSRSLWSLLRQVRAPALVVWGLQDRVVSVRKARPAAETLDRGRLLLLQRTGHVAHMERPRVVAQATIAMLDAVRNSSW